MGNYVGRLAPSPTGALHLGNIRTFMLAWLRARTTGGRILFRMEDLDHPRDKIGAAAEVIRDLRWLGFDWDDECIQSERLDLYRDAIHKLHAAGNAYPCICSRRDVENAQSAPHAGDQLYYAGTCRNRFADWNSAASALTGTGRTPCWRFRVPAATTISFIDGFAGFYQQDVSNTLGDFPLARDVGGAGYTLASVVDDAATGVTEVVRGEDLLPATPAQILIQRALGLSPVSYFHVPLVTGSDGRRLAKRHGDTRIATYRAAGITPEKILGHLAATCGMGDGAPITLSELVPLFHPEVIPHATCVMANNSPLSNIITLPSFNLIRRSS